MSRQDGAWREATASRARTRQWQQCTDTGRRLRTMQQQGYSGHSSERAAPLSCLQAGGTVHATQSRERFLPVRAQAHPEEVGALRVDSTKENRHLGISDSRSTIRQLLKKYYFQEQNKKIRWGGKDITFCGLGGGLLIFFFWSFMVDFVFFFFLPFSQGWKGQRKIK